MPYCLVLFLSPLKTSKKYDKVFRENKDLNGVDYGLRKLYLSNFKQLSQISCL